MKSKFQIYFARCLICFVFSMQTAFIPTREAHAVLPVVAAAAMLLVEGSTTTNIIASTAVIGTVLGLAFLAEDSVTAPDTGNSFADFPTGTRDRTERSTPAGWSGPIAPPATDGSATIQYHFTGGIFFTQPNVDPISSCNGIIGEVFTSGALVFTAANIVSTGSGNFCSVNFTVTNDGVPAADQQSTLNNKVETGSCATGYVNNDGTCELQNESLVALPEDGRCEILASVSGFTIDPQDAECSDLVSNGVSVSGGSVTATRSDGSVDTFTINGDGSRTYERATPDVESGTTTVGRITLSPSETTNYQSIVSGTTINQFSGTGSLVGSGSQPLNIDLPDDYNRETTQQGILDALTSDVPDVSDIPPAGDAIIAAAGDAAVSFTEDLSGSAQKTDLGWTFVPSIPTVGSCVSIPFGVGGGSIIPVVNWDWCDTLGKLRDIWGWFFSVLASLYIWRRGVSALGGEI
jgi:hypothetical protein